jgi:hypothetical protein
LVSDFYLEDAPKTKLRRGPVEHKNSLRKKCGIPPISGGALELNLRFLNHFWRHALQINNNIPMRFERFSNRRMAFKS